MATSENPAPAEGGLHQLSNADLAFAWVAALKAGAPTTEILAEFNRRSWERAEEMSYGSGHLELAPEWRPLRRALSEPPAAV